MARLAVLVQGLRSHPLQEIYRMDFVTASQAGDRFTPCRSQHTGFAMTIMFFCLGVLSRIHVVNLGRFGEPGNF